MLANRIDDVRMLQKGLHLLRNMYPARGRDSAHEKYERRHANGSGQEVLIESRVIMTATFSHAGYPAAPQLKI
jgi:hypothetical protein